MAFEFSRNQRDANYEASTALAAGGANSAAFDLEQVIGGDIEKVVLQLDLPAVDGLSDTKVLTFALEDSADGITFAAVDPAISTTQTGADGTGAAAKDVRLRFPPITRRYVRIAQTADATPGTLDESFTTRLLF